MTIGEYISLSRVSPRKKPRTDWPVRWRAAAEACNWRGVLKPKKDTLLMAARKNSPIWEELAKGAGGFRDAIGEGEPPFAYGSGMGWKKVESKKLKVESDDLSETTENAKDTKALDPLPKNKLKEIISSAIERIIPKSPMKMVVKYETHISHS